MSKQNQGGSDRGKNLGQGLGNIKDNQRRDLAGSGARAPTQDQAARPTSGDQAGSRDRHSGTVSGRGSQEE